jgi:succinate dehydrogenase / fumarate reductase cytochrome b subunit
MHFTTGTWEPAGAFSETDVYSNLVTSFRIWWVTLFYVISMIALGLHLYHGAWSSVRSLGMSQPSKEPLHRTIALGVAVIVWLGFTAVPVAIFAGLIG